MLLQSLTLLLQHFQPIEPGGVENGCDFHQWNIEFTVNQILLQAQQLFLAIVTESYSRQ